MSSLAMETWSDLISLALKNAGVVGVGQTPMAEDLNDSAKLLNSMISIWQRKRYLIYHLPQMHIPCTGATSYTIGPGGDFDMDSRPASIKSAYALQTVNNTPNQISYPLAIISSAEDYDRISLKGLQSFPEWIWYDAAYPLGVIRPYPVITGQFELYIRFEALLQRIENLADEITTPPEYTDAMFWNLAVRLAIAYQLPVSPDLKGQAKNTLETLRSVNAQIPTMLLPRTLTGGGQYNAYSDRVGPAGR
jgi:hypothetical protein